jgi:hypothetical protein
MNVLYCVGALVFTVVFVLMLVRFAQARRKEEEKTQQQRKQEINAMFGYWYPLFEFAVQPIDSATKQEILARFVKSNGRSDFPVECVAVLRQAFMSTSTNREQQKEIECHWGWFGYELAKHVKSPFSGDHGPLNQAV